MATQIANTTQSLTNAAEMRETTKMLMQPYANWEAYLTPAPLSVAIMAELVIISSQKDFSINEKPPKDGFQYLKHPDSFRACLMQICNSGWHAFNEAQKNMDQIRIHTGTVPDYMKAAVNILFNTSDKVVETLLPIQLKNIQSIADNCLALANSVEMKFLEVINLIHELLEACQGAQKLYGEELKKVQVELQGTKFREQEATKMKEQYSKTMEAMSKQVAEAQNAYKETMDKLPSGWKIIAMDFVEGLTSGVTAMMTGFTFRMAASFQEGAQPSTNQSNRDDNADLETKMKVCSKSDVILKLAGSLKEYVVEGKIDWKLCDQENECKKTTVAETQFKRIYDELKNMPEDELLKNILSLCNRGITICEELAKYTTGEKWDEQKTKQLIENIEKLNDDAFTFDCKSKRFSGTPALAPKPPMMFNIGTQNSGRKSASQRECENAHFRIEQSREQLKEAKQEYEKTVEKMVNNQKELKDIVIEMQKLEFTEIDFKTTIEILRKGLSAMGRVKMQWEKMVQFFQMVSSIIKASFNEKLLDFVKTSDGAKELKELSYTEKLFTKDLLYTVYLPVWKKCLQFSISFFYKIFLNHFTIVFLRTSTPTVHTVLRHSRRSAEWIRNFVLTGR
uniref:Uncharacterized protein n=1 Tax=Seriola dumerili TaxID=41447 RepID=A0A3B4TR56_SERDU